MEAHLINEGDAVPETSVTATITAEQVKEILLSSPQRELNDIGKQLLDVEEEEIFDLQRLGELGFTQTPNYTEKEHYLRLKKRQEWLETKKKYYESKYPGKFFTQQDYELLHKKYGLIMAKPKNLIKPIPKENLKTLLDFQYDIRDVYIKQLSPERMRSTWSNEYLGSPIVNTEEWYSNIYWHNEETELEKKFIEEIYDTIANNINLLNKIKSMKLVQLQLRTTNDVRSFFINPYKVISNKEDFKLDRDEQINEKGEVITIPVDDPIICLKVIGGYLYITSWGKEAILFNEEKYGNRIIEN